jgi:SAM-dependent methyltransferase
MTIDEAIRQLRSEPKFAELVRDAYLGRDVSASAQRFEGSGEFREVLSILGDRVQNATVVDIGAGTGIASLAFLSAGAERVIAVEPDPSDEVGRGAIRRLDRGRTIEVIDAFGEELPLGAEAADIVYARQVLHHAQDLASLMRECARILRRGGTFIACREHVVNDHRQLEQFRRGHPVHRLAGGENAFALSAYRSAITDAGLALSSVMGPTESVINAFPAVNSTDEMPLLVRRVLEHRLGRIGAAIASVPMVESLVRRRMSSAPGRLYTFVAKKP